MRCNAETFAQMYEAVYMDLYRFAVCIMRNRQEAEDAVSEAVVAAYENIGKLRSRDAFKNWIFTILANICRKKIKKASRKMEQSGEAFTLFASEEPDYSEMIDVRQAFFIVSDEEQEIVGLSVFAGYNSQEIAQMLRMNPNTVRSKRSRALQKMECILK